MKKMIKRMILSVIICVSGYVRAAEYYVSPSGSASGDGSFDRPWDLDSALSHPPVVKPGDTIWLRGGTYGGNNKGYTNSLNGTKEAPIKVRQFPGERAIIDGGIDRNYGGYVWWWGFEITNSDTRRLTDPNFFRRCGLNLQCRTASGGWVKGNKAINLIVHNAGHPGIGFWNQQDDGEIYGCLVFANGVYDTVTSPGTPASPWTRGCGTYAQNDAGNPLISDNMFFWNFTEGIDCYGEGGGVRGFSAFGNINFDNNARDLWFTTNKEGNPVERLTVRENCTYTRSGSGNKGGAQCGYKGDNNDMAFTDNYIVAGHNGTTGMFFTRKFDTVTFRNNTIIGPGVCADNYVYNNLTLRQLADWDNNRYHGGEGSAGKPFHYGNNQTGENDTLSFDAWKNRTGFDLNSVYTLNYPSANRVFVRPNKYEAGRAHIAVYNWEKRPLVRVDVSSSGLAPGDTYEVYDVQNIFGKPLISGVFNGSAIEVPMGHDVNSAVNPIIGSITHMTIKHSPVEFGAFLLKKTGVSAGAATEEPASDMSAFPNPWRQSEGENLKFTGLPSGARLVLKVFDTRGRLIREAVYDAPAAGGYIEWDGKDASGVSVGRGVYHCTIEGDTRKNVKVGILK